VGGSEWVWLAGQLATSPAARVIDSDRRIIVIYGGGGVGGCRRTSETLACDISTLARDGPHGARKAGTSEKG
jgi:hypothetical protein